jgi:hypothetical protein
LLFLKGMTGALAPFSYLVPYKNPSLCSRIHQIFINKISIIH